MSSFSPPSDYSRIKVVKSFKELIASRFENGVNALCWPRALPGDFGEVVRQLDVGEGITTIEDEVLERLPVSAGGRAAIEVLLEDQRRLRDLDLAPCLDCVNGCRLDDNP